METGRLEAFSDGVFAIAITLLILDVKLPQADPRSPLGANLTHQAPHYLGYAISFIVIGMIWLNHHGIFQRIDRIDHPGLVLNLILLMCVVFIPYPTSVMASYFRAGFDETSAAAFYGATLAVTALVLAILWLYVSRGPGLLDPGVSPVEVRRLTARYFATPVLYAGAFGVALLSVPAGLALYLLIACTYFFLRARTDGEGRSSSRGSPRASSP